MDAFTFDQTADHTLKNLEKSLGRLDPDICDVSLAMGVLTLEFSDRTRFIINSHRAARQIWMAADLQAWHFSYDEIEQRWEDDKQHRELGAILVSLLSHKLGVTVQL